MGKKYSSGCYNNENERLKNFSLVSDRFTEKINESNQGS